jgi:hypothetical protein
MNIFCFVFFLFFIFLFFYFEVVENEHVEIPRLNVEFFPHEKISR